MRIYPAIDIRGGKCVNLVQGKFDEETVFHDDPLDAARAFCAAGAEYIHMVDLDGARFGGVVCNEILKRVVEETQLPVQIGGGIRSMRDIEQRLEAGAARVIIGTAAIENPDFVKEAAREFKEKLAVGIDAANQFVAIHGWATVSEMSALSLCLAIAEAGIKTVIYTDILKDGMMSGVNIEATKELIEKTGLDIIASGGVSSMADLEAVEGIGAEGVIIGRAIYNGALDLERVLRRFRN